MSTSNVFLICLFFIAGVFPGQAQINISNLSEFQYGKLPNETVDFFPSYYDRAEIDYRKKGFSISTTLEAYQTTYDGRSYFNLSQVTLGYKRKKWDIKLGNFYETLGRGLMLRSFEIPGALLEDIGFRSRYYFHRDILGGSVKYRTKKASFHVMRADVLNNVLPPTFGLDDRRTNLITAVSSKVKYVKGHEAGITFLNLDQPETDHQNYISGTLNGTITRGLDYYLEYADHMDHEDFAFYTGLSGYFGAFSYALEFKKYENFVLGSGINEPPAGVKQQTYRVLNRSIHVSNPLNETGYQIDLFYNFKDGTIINLNHSIAKNTFGTNSTTFRQFFFEIQSSIGKNTDYKGFIDFSQDPFKGEDNRFSIGLHTDIGLNEKVRLLPEIEYQAFTRDGSDVYNWSVLLGVNLHSKLFISALGELTSDPFLVKENEASRLYFGSFIRYNPSYKHSVQLFFGERRGGPQCTAGVCYEILDFKGIELRWTGKFRT